MGCSIGGLLIASSVYLVLPLVATMIFLDVPAANSDQIFPMMVTNLPFVGVVGLVMQFGRCDHVEHHSTLNSTSAWSPDFVKVARPDMSEKAMANIGRLVMGIVMIVAALSHR